VQREAAAAAAAAADAAAVIRSRREKSQVKQAVQPNTDERLNKTPQHKSKWALSAEKGGDGRSAVGQASSGTSDKINTTKVHGRCHSELADSNATREADRAA
jgi:hypothetical protein